MTGGILFLLNYLQKRDTAVVDTTTNSTANTNSVANVNSANITVPVGGEPTMSSVKVEFRAATDAISLTSVSDGKTVNETVAAGAGVSFEPKDSLRLKYAKALINSARLPINGKSIELPDANANPGRAVIEFEINKVNLGKIWNDGRIGSEPGAQQTQTATNSRPNVANTSNTSRPT